MLLVPLCSLFEGEFFGNLDLRVLVLFYLSKRPLASLGGIRGSF